MSRERFLIDDFEPAYLSLSAADLAERVDRALDLVRLEPGDLEATSEVIAAHPAIGSIARTARGLVHLLDPAGLLEPLEETGLDQAVHIGVDVLDARVGDDGRQVLSCHRSLDRVP